MNNKQMKRYFSMAKNASEFGSYFRYKLGCVIVYKNKVISVGWNTCKENPTQKKYNTYRGFDVDTAKNYAHAEINALISAKYLDINWNKVSIFVYREYKNGNIAPARPCPACMKAITDIGIKNIYYTDRGKYIHEILE